ncbi:MAG TPA: hypothetical protein VHG09_12750 [Longimicrobiales bacterium]|nr:hypothetical protein [Longimicrobiales bacterium]
MGCLRRAIALLMVLLLLAGAWMFRDRIRTAWNDWRGTEEEVLEPSAELAAGAEARLDSLRAGTATSVSLSAIELESLLLHTYRGVLPAFLDSPQVSLDGDQLQLRARVPIDKLPRVDGFGEAAAFLPDTTELAVSGKLIPLDSGRIGFGIDDVSAARVPLPERFIAGALTRLGRRDEAGLPDDAIAVPLPAGAAAAYIRGDSLVLLARPRADGN